MKNLACFIAGLLSLASCGTTINTNKAQSEEERLRDRTKVLEAEVGRLQKENDDLRNANTVLRSSNELYEDVSGELQKAIGDLKVDGVEKLPNGSYSFGVDLLFSPGSSKIHAEGERIMKKLLTMWKGKDVRFRIVGHTDRDPILKTATRYPSKTNVELGMHRAFTVMEFFMSGGVSEKQIDIASAGNNCPIAPNDDNPANKKKNRRVEIYVLKGSDESFQRK